MPIIVNVTSNVKNCNERPENSHFCYYFDQKCAQFWNKRAKKGILIHHFYFELIRKIISLYVPVM